MAELFLPVAFMGLLILIKTITTVYDSPNVAYYCGNAYPWFYSSTAISNANDLPQSIPYVCTMKPDTCSLGNYYNDASTFSTDGTNSFTVYDKYGELEINSFFLNFIIVFQLLIVRLYRYHSECWDYK